MRTFTIVDDGKHDITKNIIDKLQTTDVVCVFTRNSDLIKTQTSGNVVYVSLPESVDNLAKEKNYIIKWCKDKYPTTKYLHIIEGNTKIVESPTKFINNTEHLMTVFKLSSWFSTITDTMNLVFGKYNPRLFINMDCERFEHVGLESVVFTAYANTQWTIFNISSTIDDILFDENYKTKMITMVDYFGTRATQTKGGFNFMYMNPTTASEHGVFIAENPVIDKPTKEMISSDNKLIQDKKVNIQPLHSIDIVLESMYEVFTHYEN